MNRRTAFRGQPLLLVAGVLAGWLALRAAMWEPPFELAGDIAADLPGLVAGPLATAPAPREAAIQPGPSAEPAPAAVSPWLARSPEPLPLRPLLPSPPTLDGAPAPAASQVAPAAVPARAVIGHNLLFLAGLAQMEVPLALLPYLQRLQAPPQSGAPVVAQAAPRAVPNPAGSADGRARWAADGWLLLREGGSAPLLGGRPSYGRSQGGAVLRYRLAPSSPHRPEAHARISGALAGGRENEAAAGLSARPLPGVPVRVAAEARVLDTDRGRELRPAVYAVSELAPVTLPLGARGEAYLQAGYVGGDYATAFVDGQARVERTLLRSGEAELVAGGAVWGGAQKGASRLDVGPSAAVTFRLGPNASGARGRVTADYRFRVAGDADPASGPALTLSAGF